MSIPRRSGISTSWTENADRSAPFEIVSGSLGQFGYTGTLANMDLTKVAYAYGTRDTAVGRLTDEKIRILKSRNAQVVSVSSRIGFITSGGYGHVIGKSLAMALVEPEFAETGTEVSAHVVAERFPARVMARSPYDPAGKAMRM